MRINPKQYKNHLQEANNLKIISNANFSAMMEKLAIKTDRKIEKIFI